MLSWYQGGSGRKADVLSLRILLPYVVLCPGPTKFQWQKKNISSTDCPEQNISPNPLFLFICPFLNPKIICDVMKSRNEWLNGFFCLGGLLSCCAISTPTSFQQWPQFRHLHRNKLTQENCQMVTYFDANRGLAKNAFAFLSNRPNLLGIFLGIGRIFLFTAPAAIYG